MCRSQDIRVEAIIEGELVDQFAGSTRTRISRSLTTSSQGSERRRALSAPSSRDTSYDDDRSDHPHLDRDAQIRYGRGQNNTAATHDKACRSLALRQDESTPFGRCVM